MRVAFVYDRVNKFGGVERVLLALHRLWPEAPLFTAVYNPKTAAWAKVFQVKPSFLQSFPLARTYHEFYPWLTPIAFESFSFDEFDLVISVTSAEAKGIITKPETLHVCYCLTPTRYLWSHEQQYLKQPGLGRLSSLGRWVFKAARPWMKQWDKVAAQRPDVYLAISKEVKKRIKKYYQRDSEVVCPGIDYEKFAKIRQNTRVDKNAKYFLVVSRLVPYKNIDLAIKACNQLRLKLKIVGVGREERALKSISGPTIEFLGHLTDEELIAYYQNCCALIMSGREDFGLAALEVQAAGRPVIALNQGGAKETVLSKETGLFFSQPKVRDLMKALKLFDKMSFSKENCQQNAAKFDTALFISKFKDKVEELWNQHQIV